MHIKINAWWFKIFFNGPCATQNHLFAQTEVCLVLVGNADFWEFLAEGPEASWGLDQANPKQKDTNLRPPDPSGNQDCLECTLCTKPKVFKCVFPLFPYGAPNFLANTKHRREYNEHKEGRMPLALALGRVPISNLCTSTLGTGWCGCFQEQWLYFTKSWAKPFFFFHSSFFSPFWELFTLKLFPSPLPCLYGSFLLKKKFRRFIFYFICMTALPARV